MDALEMPRRLRLGQLDLETPTHLQDKGTVRLDQHRESEMLTERGMKGFSEYTRGIECRVGRRQV